MKAIAVILEPYPNPIIGIRGIISHMDMTTVACAMAWVANGGSVILAA